MKLLKPGWVAQDDHPIFSVDIHPGGGKFATGGQGDDCGRVTVWNLAPILNPKLQKDSSVPKMLCQMDNHLACVNCVRWSNSGKYLASAGDDQRVILWTKSAYGGGAVFGGGGKVNHESYKVAYTLKVHDGDVLDICWSPGDVWLATASVDNTVVVWDVEKLPATVAILKGHTGHVKGVTWDPVGKYLATQSADKTVRVWRTSDWGEEAKVSEPFEECGGTTHVLRLDWSPDGQYLVSAHAMNGGGPTAQILERDGWKFEKDFVGHRKAVTCVRFNDNIFEKYLEGVGKKAQYVCLAIGSRDRSLSVWLTSLKRPLFVIHDVFESSILDLTWSKDGMVLIACSMDGSIAAVVLKESELGTPMSKEAKNTVLKKIYGQNIGLTNSPKKTLIENPELLKLQNGGGDIGDEMEATNSVDQAPVVLQNAVKGPTDKQIEMKTSDGKRRITPMFIIPGNGDTANPAMANGNSMSSESVSKYQMQSSSSESKTKIRIEKIEGVVEPNVSPGKKTTVERTAAPPRPNMIAIKKKPGPVNSSNPAVINKAENNSVPNNSVPSTSSQTTTTTSVESNTQGTVNSSQDQKDDKKDENSKDDNDENIKANGTGKKRNRIESSSSESDSSDSGSSSSSSDDETASQTSKSGADTGTSATEVKTKSDAPSATDVKTKSDPPSVKPSILTVKRKADDLPNGSQPPAKKRGRPTTTSGTSTPVSKVVPPIPQVTTTPAPPLPTTNITHSPGRSTPGLPPLHISNNRQNFYLAQLKVNSMVLNLIVENEMTKTVYGSLHRVSAHQTTDPKSPLLWDLVLPSPVTAILAASKHLIVTCRDATLHLLDQTGARLLPALSLPAPCHKIQVFGDLLVTVTTNARLFVWRLGSLPQVILKNEEVGPLNRVNKKQSISLVKISLSKEDQPILNLSDGSVHSYSPGLGCWLQLVPARASSTNIKPPRPPPIHLATQPLAQLTAPGLNIKLDEKTEASCTTSNIEAKLSASLYLGSSTEYRYWLGALVKSLANQGLESRVRSLLDSLLGPTKSLASEWSPTVLGMNKRNLLQEILPFVGSNLAFQRLYSEYKLQLEDNTDLFN